MPSGANIGSRMELPGDIDPLDAVLHALQGKDLALSDWGGSLRRPYVIAAGSVVQLLGAEFWLLDHDRDGGALVLRVQDAACATRGALRLEFPRRKFDWRLWAVFQAATVDDSPAAQAAPHTDDEEPVRRRRDDMLRRVFN